MRFERLRVTDGRPPARRLRVCIEDPVLADDRAISSSETPFEVTVCSGPRSDRDVCPLVLDGTCPIGPFDVVVSALEGPWSPSVRAAWGQSRTPVADARDLAATEPSERLAHHLGAAVAMTVPAGPPAGAG